MSEQRKIMIKGLNQNNLKNVSLEIPKEKIVVFTGVSGSGKSSIVFDTIAAESQRQMNETYTAFIRGRLPKYEKPKVDRIENLAASVVIDQSSLGGNVRSTVGTISDMYSALRVLFSRIGTPHIGSASYFSFNDPNGMCKEYSRLLLKRDISDKSDVLQNRASELIREKECPCCHGKRLNEAALSCKIAGYNINEMCDMEFTRLCEVLKGIDDPRGKTIVEALVASLTRMIDIGLPYLFMNRESSSLSGGEAQRLKLVRYMGSSLTGMIYIFDEPSTGMHPLNVLTVVTGVAGSGKSTLIRDVFAKQYEDRVVLVDQSPVTATGRSTPATFLGFFDEIRKLAAEENHTEAALFSFNSKGACPVCKGKGVIVTELVFMDPVTTVCEACEGNRYSEEALSHRYKGKSIVDILKMSAEEAAEFFSDNKKISKQLKAMMEVGLSYLSLGQPLSTLSGGERQRVKLAKYLDKKGNIYVLDEPTTGLHASDVKNIMKLLDNFVKHGNTVIIIEHNLDVMKQADYLIDVGPDGGNAGGEVVFAGTAKEMADKAQTITARYLRKSLEGESFPR